MSKQIGYAAGSVRYDAAPQGWSKAAQKAQQKHLGSEQTGPDMGVKVNPRPEPWRLPLTASAPPKPYRLGK